MMNFDADTMINFFRMVADFILIPFVVVVWRLNGSINRLEILLYREFATKEEVRDLIRQMTPGQHHAIKS